MAALKVYRVDPRHPVIGALVHAVTQKVNDNGDFDGIWELVARMYRGDPGSLMLAALDSEGALQGYALASIEYPDVFLIQPRIDIPTDEDITGVFIGLVEKWVKGYNAANEGQPPLEEISLIARRSDPKWAKKYGFRTVKYVMNKRIE